MGDISGLMEKMQEMDLKKSMGMMENMTKGKFTLKDMRDQMQMITSMGPLSKVMAMIPGLPQEMLSLGDTDGTNRIKRCMCIFDSMTEKELQSDGKMFEEQTSRIIRVAKGSGSRVREVEEMLDQCEMYGGMVKQIGGPNGIMSTMAKGAINRGSTQDQGMNLSGIEKMLPAGLIDKIGGMGGIQQMMESMGGMTGIQKMMEGMGGLGNMFGEPSGSQQSTDKAIHPKRQ